MDLNMTRAKKTQTAPLSEVSEESTVRPLKPRPLTAQPVEVAPTGAAVTESRNNLLTDMKAKRLEQRQEFLANLATQEMENLIFGDDEAFRDMINLSTSDFNVSQAELSKMLGVSTAAVSRWKTGDNSPAPYSRVQVRNVIVTLMKRDLANADLEPA
jgi:DNA-binding transcriptional regulator YiaG